MPFGLSTPPPVLTLIRGLPGSGKTTLAARLTKGEALTGMCAADDYFMLNPDGVYRFNPAELKPAHAHCQAMARDMLKRGASVIVHNTFSCRWEMEPYLKTAAEHEAQVVVIDLFDNGLTDEELAARGIHGALIETIAKMRTRWEHDWKCGDPLPPWERSPAPMCTDGAVAIATNMRGFADALDCGPVKGDTLKLYLRAWAQALDPKPLTSEQS